jgi:hypothetical protein
MNFQPATLAAVSSFVREFFEKPQLKLGPDFCLIKDLSAVDEDDFSFFIRQVSSRFNVVWPKVSDVQRYLALLWSERGFNLFDLEIWWTRRARLFIQELTIGKLCEIVEEHKWPLEFVFPRRAIRLMEGAELSSVDSSELS